MKTFEVKRLYPGMVFSEPVYIEGNSLLVPAGIAVRKKDIERLINWGFATVKTDGVPVKGEGKPESEPVSVIDETPPVELDPGFSGGVPAKSGGTMLSLTDVQDNKGAYRRYTDLIERLDGVFTNIESGISVEPRTVDNITSRLLQAVRDDRDLIGFILGGEVSGRVMAKSSVNTAILSALIAVELKFTHHKVMQVVTAALLHDVGMLRLPREITSKSGGLSGAELQRMQAHPLYTYKIITKELLYPDDVGIAALQHHERWDGVGYPRRIGGIDMDMGARIISVADAFEAMV
ncbi:MAG: HD domain-containing protein, partial [Treponema sp.]|nr:HD domain-containing protein [Treponema sp.]